MHQLVYTSTATIPMDEDGLNQLLEQSRQRNAELEITGLLLYHQSSFMQVLEGSQKNVDLVFESIKRDTRHHHIEVVLNEAVEAREFSDWTMAFQQIKTARDLPRGYSSLLNTPFSGAEFGENVSLCRQLLLGFKCMLA